MCFKKILDPGFCPHSESVGLKETMWNGTEEFSQAGVPSAVADMDNKWFESFILSYLEEKGCIAQTFTS